MQTQEMIEEIDRSDLLCSHCGAERLGDYCQVCGQYHAEGRITFRRLWRDFVERYLKLERGVFRTFRDLLIRPGVVARNYVDGLRRPYVNPLSYLLIASALSVVLIPLYANQLYGEAFDVDNPQVREQMELGPRMSGGSLEELTPEQQERVEAFMAAVMAEVPRTVTDLYAVMYVVLALLLAGMLRLFMGGRGRQYNYAETLVFALFICAQIAVLSTVLALITYRIDQMVVLVGSILVMLSIILHGTRDFYDRSKGTLALSALSVLVTYVAYVIVIMITAFPLATYRALQGM